MVRYLIKSNWLLEEIILILTILEIITNFDLEQQVPLSLNWLIGKIQRSFTDGYCVVSIQFFRNTCNYVLHFNDTISYLKDTIVLFSAWNKDDNDNITRSMKGPLYSFHIFISLDSQGCLNDDSRCCGKLKFGALLQ